MRNLPTLSHHNYAISQKHEGDSTYKEGARDYQEVSISDYLYVFWRRKWHFFFPLILIVSFVLADNFTQPKQYMATATVLIEDANPKILTVTEVSSPDKSPNFYSTQYEIIKSRVISEKVVDKLNLSKESINQNNYKIGIISSIKEYLFNWTKFLKSQVVYILEYVTKDNNSRYIPDSPSDKLDRQDIVTYLRDKIKVVPREGTKLVDISIKTYDPVKAAQLVNSVAEAYVQKNLDDKLDASRKAKEWLSKESKLLRKRIQKAEEELYSYQKEKQIIVDPTIDKIIIPGFDDLNALREAYEKKKRERVLLRSEIDELYRRSAESYYHLDGFDNNTLRSLRTKIIELQSTYATLSNKLGNKHPKMIALKTEIDELTRLSDKEVRREIEQVIGSMKNKYNAVFSQEKKLKSLLDTHKKNLIHTEKDLAAYESLKHDIEVNKGMYGEVSRRLAETTLTTAITANNVKLIERAIIGTPVSSDAVIKLLVGLVLGLGCGAGLALLSEYRDKRFKNSIEAEQYLGIPCLGFIPRHKLPKRTSLSSPHLVTLREPWASASEAYRGIRTWVQLAQMPIKTLMIASAFPREGRSTTATNLAVSFAQLGHRVLVVDANLRQPSVHRFFGLDNTRGLTSLLENGLEWQGVLNDSPLANLKVLTAGPPPHNPTELLSTMRMKRLLASCKMCFDTIIIDVPVILPSIPDAAILAPNMDGVLIVHDQARSHRDAVLEVKKTLERAGANLLGMILNNVTPKQGQRDYAYHTMRPYGNTQIAARNGDPEVAYIDMRPIEAPKQWIVDAHASVLPIAKSAHHNSFTLTLNTMVFLDRVEGVEAQAHHVFLLLELEITNDGPVPHLFDPALTAISLQKEIGNEQQTPLWRAQNINGQTYGTLHSTNIYRYDATVTRSIEGFANTIEILPQHRSRGMIVYQIRGKHNKYMFEYKNSDINITIDFSSGYQETL